MFWLSCLFGSEAHIYLACCVCVLFMLHSLGLLLGRQSSPFELHTLTMATATEANVNGEVVPVAEKLGKLSVSEQEVLTASSPSTSEPSTPGTPATSVNSQPQYKFVPFEPHPGYPKSRISIVNRFIDQPRELRVAVIGGGLSGILAGVLLPAKVPNIKLTIYEKNHDFVS